MHKLCSTIALLALAVSSHGVLAGDVEEAVEYRQGIMNIYAYNLTSMRDMVKGKTQFDGAAFTRHAQDLAAAAGLDLLAGFPEDSVNDESDASDAIWLDWDKFQKNFQALQEQSAKLAEAANKGDGAAVKEQLGVTAKSCKGCHDDFKN
jgi:cytochrome c556